MITNIKIEEDIQYCIINFVLMYMKTIYNIKLSFLCCPDKILLNLQISKKHTLEEITILEFKFGTKWKNKNLRQISRTSGIESNHSGYQS